MLRKASTPNILVLAIAATAFFCLASCQKNGTTLLAGGVTLQLYLTDAPGDYQAAWIDIQKILVQVATDSSGNRQSGTWLEAPLLHTGAYNLLNYRNGEDTMLASVHIPVGTVSTIQLVFGKNNTLVLKDGSSVSMKTPSTVQSNVKLVVDGTARSSGPSYSLVLDFDVSRSIVKTGSGDSVSYFFIPYVRAFPKEAGGAVEGWVFPDSARAHILAISSSNDTLGTIPDPNGYYKLWGIPEGTYQLLFLPDPATGYQDGKLDDLGVTNGQLLTADTVRLHR